MMNDQQTNMPLVSVIVPTKNSASLLEVCLKSIQEQSYKNIELIVVDNFSTDGTQKLAKKYTDKVFEHGPERSAQVNYGVEQATGTFVYKVDSDFILDPQVVAQCVEEISKGFDAIVVHNSPDVRVSWIAKIRKFEVDMYKYDITHSSARFVKKEVYQKIGGFNSAITAGEDYDFQNKLNRHGFKTGFVEAEALHLGEPTDFWKHMKKYYDYGKDFVNYQSENKVESKEQLGFFRSVYLKNFKKLLFNPISSVVFIIYSSIKYLFGGVGFLVGRALKENGTEMLDKGGIQQWLNKTNLNDSFLVGYYGGGNYGDELLLEVLLNSFQAKGVKNLKVYYSDILNYSLFHKVFGYAKIVDSKNKKSILKSVLISKNIIVGGGGLWGMDFNKSILALSLLLFIFRFLFRKKVYIIGVGFYSSTSSLGRVGAWFAAKAANVIIVRDKESAKNFKAFKSQVQLDRDIAFALEEYDLGGYIDDLEKLESSIKIDKEKKYTYITLRRFTKDNGYRDTIERLIAADRDANFILSLCEPVYVDRDGYLFIQKIASSRSNIQFIDFSYNPVALYLFFRKYALNIKVIAPQFHVILVSHLARVPFFPMAYDNKCSELLLSIGEKNLININELEVRHLVDFMYKAGAEYAE